MWQQLCYTQSTSIFYAAPFQIKSNNVTWEVAVALLVVLSLYSPNANAQGCPVSPCDRRAITVVTNGVYSCTCVCGLSSYTTTAANMRK